MIIACIGWGSLVWDPRELPLKAGWKPDGPTLPVEFARQSDNGRITLVLTPGAEAVVTLWCELDVQTLADAVASLASREGISANNAPTRIGRWPATAANDPAVPDGLATWANGIGLDGVVWTALGPRFGNKYITPSCDEVVAYLTSTIGDIRNECERYCRNAPAQIRTAYRSEIERQLGWTGADVL